MNPPRMFYLRKVRIIQCISFFQITLREVGLFMNSHISEGHLSIHFYGNGRFELESLEGVSSLDNRGMIGRHGNVYTNDTAEFLRSWR